jgi:hypothetical protein
MNTGIVSGQGTTAKVNRYEYRDRFLPENHSIENFEYRLVQVDFDGAVHYSFTIQITNQSIPGQFVLKPNYPNPFNPVTYFSFYLPDHSHVSLEVFNIQGQSVAKVMNAEKNAGWHRIAWHPYNQASGVYYFRISSNYGSFFQRMILLR